MFEQTKTLCQYFLKRGIPSFDLIVYKDGQCVLRHMGGYADPDKKIPMTGKEKYHIYSCSKLFTCVAAMQLWEKGIFSLNDNLADYLPTFREMTIKTETGIEKAKNPIKIHHLFEMTAGLNYNLQTPALQTYYEACDRRCPTVELVNEIAKAPLEFGPGTGWQYSLCHDVLGALVEVLSGEKFENYVKTHIFDTLGMENSDFLHPMEEWNGFARQFYYNSETGEYEPRWKNAYRPGKEYASGGAGCVSTVEDYIKFLEALRVGDVILKEETIAMMATDRLTEQQRQMYTYIKWPTATVFMPNIICSARMRLAILFPFATLIKQSFPTLWITRAKERLLWIIPRPYSMASLPLTFCLQVMQVQESPLP